MAEDVSNTNNTSHKMHYMENEGECGYFKDKTAVNLITNFQWLDSDPLPEYFDCVLYDRLIQQGFRRYSSIFYLNICKDCRECIPIRIRAEDFICSKSQRRVLKKNMDVEVEFVTKNSQFWTDEKKHLFRDYYNRHNLGTPGYKKMTLKRAAQELKEMNTGYGGIINFNYRLGGKLIGVSVIDFMSDKKHNITSISSNYFYYDVSQETLKRSIGVFSVLFEIDYCLKNNIPYYYLGLYLPHCRKMNYKINYKPYQLLLDGFWTESTGLEQYPQVVENYLRFDNIEKDNSDEEETSPVQLDTSDIFTFPEPGVIYGHEDICLITSTIPLRMLYSAYIQGVFPWFNEFNNDPVLWQSPVKRFVLPVEKLHVSKSIEKFLKHNPYTYTMDKAFDQVIRHCAEQKRPNQEGSWIGPKIIRAFTQFHKAGYVHSFEVWKDEKLVGGFYGVLIGSIFCGESMFTIEPNSSKSAFVLFARAFQKAGGKLIDCQAYTKNMARYGAKEIPRKDYLELLKKYKDIPLKEEIQVQLDCNKY